LTRPSTPFPARNPALHTSQAIPSIQIHEKPALQRMSAHHRERTEKIKLHKNDDLSKRLPNYPTVASPARMTHSTKRKPNLPLRPQTVGCRALAPHPFHVIPVRNGFPPELQRA
jgi:hypothetical protein